MEFKYPLDLLPIRQSNQPDINVMGSLAANMNLLFEDNIGSFSRSSFMAADANVLATVLVKRLFQRREQPVSAPSRWSNQKYSAIGDRVFGDLCNPSHSPRAGQQITGDGQESQKNHPVAPRMIALVNFPVCEPRHFDLLGNG